MQERIPVYVYSRDPVLEAGIASELGARQEVWISRASDSDGPGAATVAVVVADEVDADALATAKALQRRACRVVLVAARVDDAGLISAVEAGVCGLLRRSEAVPERLVAAVRSAVAGEGMMPPDLLGRLLHQVGRLHRQVLEPRGVTLSGLTAREIHVLRLVAEGRDTTEIAAELAYSTRTIKNVLHDLTTRLNLRNRTQAVAYAIREGLI